MNSSLPPSPVSAAAVSLDRPAHVWWLRRLVRLIALLGVLLLAIGLVGGRLTAHLDKSGTRSAVPPRDQRSPSSDFDKSAGRAADVPRDGAATSAADAAINSRVGNADDLAANDASADAAGTSYESPLIRALGAVVDQNDQVFGDASDQIEQSLVEGDQILSGAKSANRAAIRQANRQVRLPGRSPHVLILLVEGLSVHDLGCYAGGESLTPNADGLAHAGSRLTRFDSAAASRSSPVATSVNSFRSSRTPRVLWNSGYSTSLIGDCSHAWATDDSWDEVFGWKTRLVDIRPTAVVSNGRTLRVAGKSAATGVRFDEVLTDEIASWLQANAARRPVAMVLNTPLDWWHTGASDGTHAAAVKEWDRFLGRVLATADRIIGKKRAIVIVAGTSRQLADEKLELTESGGPLMFAWPGHIPAGNVIDRPADFDDLLPTIARLIGSTRAD